MSECPVCVREQAVRDLLKNPSEKTRKTLFELVGFEQGFVLSNINLTKSDFCEGHKNFESFKRMLLVLNDPDVVSLLFGSNLLEIKVH
jgi:hypothetical protein